MNTDLQGRFPEREHYHKFFQFSIKSAFLPLPDGNYRLVDYAYLYCYCGSAIKEELKPKDSKQDE